MSLAAITTLVDDKLASAALGSGYDTGARNRAIAEALRQYGVDVPRQLAVEVEHVTGSTLPVPTGWVAGRSVLGAVEYPLDHVPPSLLDDSAVRQATGGAWLVYLRAQLSDATVRVHFSAPHAIDGSTVPDEHCNAVACWAAAELCRQMATRYASDVDATMGAAAVNNQSRSGDMARRAREWAQTYRATLGLPDPDKVTVGGAAGAVVSFGRDRQRGRFSSLGN